MIWNVYNAYVPVILADRFLMAPILGPIGYGWIIQLSGARYNFLMIVRPVFMLLALISIMCVTKGEAKQGQNIH
ncbi:MAG TPA: hypothetical protein G4N92_05640 [Anaerolineae bacterium]|nr:hypothetical protein [Anaerolineae bacterium]